MIVIKYLTAILQDAMLAVDIIVTLTDFFFFFLHLILTKNYFRFFFICIIHA